jgi:hypothetical protein
MKIRVCIPCKTLDDIEPHCQAGLDSLKNLGWEITAKKGFYCQDNKNAGITDSQVMRQTDFGFDKILFVDSDIGFTQADAIRIVNSPHDVIGGGYPFKEKEMAHLLVAGMMDPVKAVTHVERGQGITPVDWVGSGFFCVSADALRKLEYPYYREHLVKYGDKQVGYKDDIGFCFTCRQVGIPVYLDNNIMLKHFVTPKKKITMAEYNDLERKTAKYATEVLDTFGALMAVIKSQVK